MPRKKRTIINHRTPGIARGVPIRSVTTSPRSSRSGLKRTATTRPIPKLKRKTTTKRK